MKLTLDKSKLLSTLKGAGAVIADDKTAEAVATAINALIPNDEFLTESEVETKLHDVREEAKARRGVIDDLVKTITGKERNEFDEKDRSKKMLDAVTNELGVLKTQNKEYQENMEPLKAKVESIEKAEHEKIMKSWSGDKGKKAKLIAIFADENNSKYKSDFNFAGDEKELTDEQIAEDVTRCNHYEELGVPDFQSESAAPEENNNPKSKQKPAGSVKGTMTMDELMEKRHSAGLPS